MEIITAVIIFVLGQIAQKFIIEPWAKQRDIIGQIHFHLVFSATVGQAARLVNTGEMTQEQAEETKSTLRTLAAQIHQSLWEIPFYDTLAEAKLIPKRADILEISSELIGWSNSLSDNPEPYKKRIKEILRLNQPIRSVASSTSGIAVAPVEQKSEVHRLSADLQTDIDKIIEDQPVKKPRRTIKKT